MEQPLVMDEAAISLCAIGLALWLCRKRKTVDTPFLHQFIIGTAYHFCHWIPLML